MAGKGNMRRKLVSRTKLKVDKGFTPCPVADDDELFPNGIFKFNITKMLEWIEQTKEVSIENVAVSGFYKDSNINESHIDSVDLSRPVILAEIAPDRYNLIDGHHRMEKARRMKVKDMPAYRLNVGQHISFLTSESSYLTYVEYWNDKLG
jgi:hypothetical protein